MAAIRMAIIENDERLRKEREEGKDSLNNRVQQYQSVGTAGHSNGNITVDMQHAFMLQQ